MIPSCPKCGAIATGLQTTFPQGYRCGGTEVTDKDGKTDFQRHSFGNLNTLSPEIAKSMGWDDYDGLLKRLGIRQTSSLVWADIRKG